MLSSRISSRRGSSSASAHVPVLRLLILPVRRPPSARAHERHSQQETRRNSQVHVLQIDDVDQKRVVAHSHEDVVLKREGIPLEVDDFLDREADEKLLEVLHCRMDLVDQFPQALQERQRGCGIRAST